MIFICPYCGSKMKNRSTQFQNRFLAVEYHQCTRPTCGASFRIVAEMKNVMQEPIEMAEAIDVSLPVGRYNHRRDQTSLPAGSNKVQPIPSSSSS